MLEMAPPDISIRTSSRVCARCNVYRALILRPKTNERLCKLCFLTVFEEEVHSTITAASLFRRGDRVAIGASGGKDSTVLASILNTLNQRYDYGVTFILLAIDEGIKGYRDDALETVKRNAVQYDMELSIVSYAELYGWSMDQVVAQIGKKGNCTYCGVFRRQALDRGAERLKLNHVVTGHNADDIAETVLMNLLRGDLPRLHRCTSIKTQSSLSPIARSKPLKYAYEKEIVLYAHHKQLDYFTTECVYSPEAFRGSARSLIKSLERVRPSAILDIVRSGEAFTGMVPESIQKSGCGSSGLCVEAVDGASGSNCGNGGGGIASGGFMVDVEKQLIPERVAQTQGLETEIKMPARVKKKGKQQTPKKDQGQKKSSCKNCGYLTSSELCQACALLGGLNKNRSQLPIEVEVADARVQLDNELAVVTG